MHRYLPGLIIITLNFLLLGFGSYEILHLPNDARSLSLNNTTSVYNGSFLNNNPASISMHPFRMSYSFFYLPANILFGEIHYSENRGKGVGSLNISLLNYGTIIDSKTEKKSHAFDAIVKIGYKRELKNIVSVGISGGYLFSSIAEFYSHLLYSNIGIRSRFLEKRLGVGLSVENIGKLLKPYTDYQEPIPAISRTSFYYEPKHVSLIFHGNIVKNLDNNSSYFSSGLEFIPKHQVILRLGGQIMEETVKEIFYNIKEFEHLLQEYIDGMSVGVGFEFNKTIVDIGLLNMKSVGFAFGFSITKKYR